MAKGGKATERVDAAKKPARAALAQPSCAPRRSAQQPAPRRTAAPFIRPRSVTSRGARKGGPHVGRPPSASTCWRRLACAGLARQLPHWGVRPSRVDPRRRRARVAAREKKSTGRPIQAVVVVVACHTYKDLQHSAPIMFPYTDARAHTYPPPGRPPASRRARRARRARAACPWPPSARPRRSPSRPSSGPCSCRARRPGAA